LARDALDIFDFLNFLFQVVSADRTDGVLLDPGVDAVLVELVLAKELPRLAALRKIVLTDLADGVVVILLLPVAENGDLQVLVNDFLGDAFTADRLIQV